MCREAVEAQGPALRTDRRAVEREGWEAGRRRKELAAEAEKARTEERRRQEEDSSVARQRKDSVHRARPVPQYRWGGGPVLPRPGCWWCSRATGQ
jgi:hypothetical protein